MGAGQQKRKAAESAMNQEMDRAGHILQAYRPEATQARLAALQQTAGLFNPVNNAIGQMYGPQSMFDIQAATQNPMSERMQGLGHHMGDSVGWEQPGQDPGHMSFKEMRQRRKHEGKYADPKPDGDHH